MVRVIARPLQDRGLQVGVAAGGVGQLEGLRHDVEHGLDPFLVVVAGLQQHEMGRPLVQSGPQRFLALAFEELLDLLDVGHKSGLIVLGRPQGDVLRRDRLHVGAAELRDLRDLLETRSRSSSLLFSPWPGTIAAALSALPARLRPSHREPEACLIASICSAVNPSRASCFSTPGVTAKPTPCSAAFSAILSGGTRCCRMRPMSRRESGFSSPRAARPELKTMAARSIVRTALRSMNIELPRFVL